MTDKPTPDDMARDLRADLAKLIEWRNKTIPDGDYDMARQRANIWVQLLSRCLPAAIRRALAAEARAAELETGHNDTKEPIQ